jgi:hypothetical protein
MTHENEYAASVTKSEAVAPKGASPDEIIDIADALYEQRRAVKTRPAPVTTRTRVRARPRERRDGTRRSSSRGSSPPGESDDPEPARGRSRPAEVAHGHDKRAWEIERGLRQSTARSEPVEWLLGKPYERRGEAPRRNWFDHGTRWRRGGEPCCLVGQPYDLTPEDREELLDLEREHGLRVQVSCFPGWHYPGAVLSVVVRRTEDAT